MITAAGERHFSTGADVGAVASRGGVAAGKGPLSEEVHWSPRQNRVWKPTVTAVNGMVAGAGLHFVVDADIIVAAEHAVFLDTHVNVGMVGAIENIGLAKRLPLGTALRMTLCGKTFRLPAERAYQLGLVDEVVPADQLMATADDIAHQIAANSPAAVQLSMQAIWGSRRRCPTPRPWSTAGRCCGCTGTIPTARRVRGRSPRSATPQWYDPSEDRTDT